MQGPHVLLTFDNAWHYILALTYSWPTQIGHSEANIVAKFLGLMPPPNPVLAVVDTPHLTPIKILSILWWRHAAPYCPIACSARWHAAPCSTRWPPVAPSHAVPGGILHQPAPMHAVPGGTQHQTAPIHAVPGSMQPPAAPMHAVPGGTLHLPAPTQAVPPCIPQLPCKQFQVVRCTPPPTCRQCQVARCTTRFPRKQCQVVRCTPPPTCKQCQVARCIPLPMLKIWDTWPPLPFFSLNQSKVRLQGTIWLLTCAP